MNPLRNVDLVAELHLATENYLAAQADMLDLIAEMEAEMERLNASPEDIADYKMEAQIDRMRGK